MHAAIPKERVIEKLYLILCSAGDVILSGPTARLGLSLFQWKHFGGSVDPSLYNITVILVLKRC
jgi:hypothetical protein